MIAACESALIISDRSPYDDAVSHDTLPWFVCVAYTSGNIINIANREPFVKRLSGIFFPYGTFFREYFSYNYIVLLSTIHRL